MQKKKFNFITLGIITVLIIAGLYIILKQKKEMPIPSKEETLIEKQTRELNELRANAKPLTSGEINEQSEGLESLRGGAEPMSAEEIKKQTEEMDNLRQQLLKF